MFVTSFETIVCAGDGAESKVFDQPSWDAVAGALQSLDGNVCDSVVLNGTNDAYMGIVGGYQGQYVVAGRQSDGKSFILTIGGRRGTWIPVMVGGQENEYADNEVVTLKDAIIAAHTFFESGECDHRYKWNEKAARMTA